MEECSYLEIKNKISAKKRWYHQLKVDGFFKPSFHTNSQKYATLFAHTYRKEIRELEQYLLIYLTYEYYRNLFK